MVPLVLRASFSKKSCNVIPLASYPEYQSLAILGKSFWLSLVNVTIVIQLCCHFDESSRRNPTRQSSSLFEGYGTFNRDKSMP